MVHKGIELVLLLCALLDHIYGLHGPIEIVIVVTLKKKHREIVFLTNVASVFSLFLTGIEVRENPWIVSH